MKIFRSKVKWQDSFQELLDIWEENKLCQVESSEDQYSWLDCDKRVLLHEHDRCKDVPDFDIGFFANDSLDQPNAFPWIYWARRPKKLEAFVKQRKSKSYNNRSVSSVFIGAAENPVQYVNRTRYDWGLAVEEYDFNDALFKEKVHKYTNDEFLEKISNAKFGLCLEGYGPKCQRDIEYIALGVVPIFTWKTFNNYAFPLKENVHYLYADNPKEAKEKIKNCNQEQWQIMSDNCRHWYQRYASPIMAFYTTRDLINEKVFSSNS